MLAIVSVGVEMELVLFGIKYGNTGQGLRDKTRTCALICHYLHILLSNPGHSNQSIDLSIESLEHSVSISALA